MKQQQFENFTASSLYCDKCKAAMPVRERLLLVLPDKEAVSYTHLTLPTTERV